MSKEYVLRVYYYDSTNDTYTGISIAKSTNIPDVCKTVITLVSGTTFTSMTIDNLRKKCILVQNGKSHVFDTRIVQVIPIKV